MPGKVQTDRAARLALELPPEPQRSGELVAAEVKTAATQAPQPEPSYYDISILQRPSWKWEIASYFYLGGLSAGAYAISRVAERAGGERYRDLVRVGSALAFLTFLPCPPLLILDLGDPKRFHHMLRVWKPTTPMNLGTWTLVAYSGMAGTELLRQWTVGRRGPLSAAHVGGGNRLTRLAWILHDLAGIPFSIMIAGYTGVLLSCTANPMWCRSRWLGPLFSASALSTGAAATSLALHWRGVGPDSPSQRALVHIDTAAHVAEAITLGGYLREMGPKAKPLTHGSMRRHLWLSVGGIVASEVLKHLPLPPRAKRWARIASSAIGLIGAFSMRWAMVYGGHGAAADPHTARLATRPKPAARPAVPSTRPTAPSRLVPAGSPR